ncbi:unnamed protein product [Closterium sp. NIES-53]
MDAEMASWKSTGTYVDEVPPPGANIISGMWVFRVKRPPGSPPVFKARYVARGFSQRQGVDYFQTFSPTPKMTTLRVLLHVCAQRDYELHSLDFSTAFLQGSLHEEIWLRRPPGFTGSFPPGTQWSLWRPVYGLRQAPREWHDTLRTTLAALGFSPSTADPSLFFRTNTLLPPFYVLVYVDDLVFATADTAGLAHVKSELQKRHTCTDLGELRSYLGLEPEVHPLRSSQSASFLVQQLHVLLHLAAVVSQPRFFVAAQSSPSSLGFSAFASGLTQHDNKAMLALCREHRLEHRTKHIALRYFLARELQQRGQLRLAYVASQANTADIFTKALQPCDHQRFCTMLACFAFLCLPGLLTPSSPPLCPWGVFGLDKFNGDNFAEWSFKMENIFDHYDLLEVMEGTQKRPENDPEKSPWVRKSAQGYLLLGQALGSSQIRHIKPFQCETEKGPKAWAALKGVHAPATATVAVVLERQMAALRIEEDEAVEEGVQKFFDLLTRLEGADLNYSELQKKTKLLALLPESWSSLIINLNRDLPHLSLEDVKRAILQDDFCRRELANADGAGAASIGRGYGLGRGRGRGGGRFGGSNFNGGRGSSSYGNDNKNNGRGLGRVCVAKNRALTHVGADKWVPYVEWIGRKPKVDMLRVFGCMCMALVPKHLRHNKLGAKAIWAVHLGMAQNSKGWLLWDLFTMKFLVSRDCKFMENLMYKDWKAENEAKIGMRFGEVKSSGLEHVELPLELSSGSTTTMQSSLVNGGEESKDAEEEEEEVQQVSKHAPTLPSRTTSAPRIRVTPQQRQGLHVPAAEEEGRGKRRIQAPNRLTYDALGNPAKSALAGAALIVEDDKESDDEECAFAFFSPVEMPGEPATLKEALESSHAEEWKKAMEIELKSIEENGTWELVELPEGRKAITSKWLFKIKSDADGKIECYKSRLVAKGYQQKEKVDYKELFAPVVKPTTLRTLLAGAAIKGRVVKQMDVTTAFLNGVLEEEIFMAHPEGFDDGSGRVPRLKKVLYGLKQATRQRYLKLRGVLEEIGFTPSSADHSLFMLGEGEQRSFMVVYVDDILIFSPSSDLVKEVMLKLQDKFKCKALGDVSFYLGLHIERDVEKRCMRVHQRKYLEALAATFGQIQGHVATPFPSGFKCVKGPEEESVGEEERRRFHSLVGSLMVAKYLGQTSTVGLQYSAAAQRRQKGADAVEPRHLFLTAFSDASYASEPEDMTSVGGFICCVGGGPTAWESKKQVDQALSLVESEYMALFRAVREIVWQRRLLAEFGEEQQGPTPLYCDSQGAIALAKNPVLHGLTKHMRFRDPSWLGRVWHCSTSLYLLGFVGVVARSSTILPCPTVPSGSLSGLHIPSFSTNLVSTAALQDAMVTTTTLGGQCVSICTCTQTGRHLATFTRRPGSSLYTLATKPSQVATSAQVSASGPVATPCSCRLLSHQTLLWHHRLGHPSLPRLRGMHSRLLVSGLPRSLPPLLPSPAPPCLVCVEERQRAAPHSSFPPTIAPLQTLHMDVWGPACVSGQGRERYFLLVVDHYTSYTTVFPLCSKGEVLDVLIPWIRAVRLQLRKRFHQDLPVLRLHSDRGGEFSSDHLRDFCPGEGILQSFMLPPSPQQNGIA